MDPRGGESPYYSEWYRYRSQGYSDSRYGHDYPPDIEDDAQGYRVYGEELHRQGPDHHRYYYDDIDDPGYRRYYLEEVERYGEREYHRDSVEGPSYRRDSHEEVGPYGEREYHRDSVEDPGYRRYYLEEREREYYRDSIEGPSYRRYSHEEVRPYGEREYHRDSVEDPGFSRYYHEAIKRYGEREYHDDSVEYPGYGRYYHEDVRSSSYSRYPHDYVEDPIYSTHHREKDPGYRTYHHDNVKDNTKESGDNIRNDNVEDSGDSRCHHDNFERQRLQKTQKSPVPVIEHTPSNTCTGQKIHNNVKNSTENAKPIPTIHGKGYNRSPKKWNEQRGTPQSVNTIINSKPATPGKQVIRPFVPASQQQGSYDKRVAVSKATVNSGFKPQENQVSNPKPHSPSLASLKGNQSLKLSTTMSQQSKIGTEISLQSVTDIDQQSNIETTKFGQVGVLQHENSSFKLKSTLLQQSEGTKVNFPRTSLDNQTFLPVTLTDLQTSSRTQSSNPSSALTSSQLTSSSLRFSSGLPGSISQVKAMSVDKPVVKERNVRKTSDSFLNKTEEKHCRPKVLVEIELVKKLEGIELGTQNKEREKIKDLPVKVTDSGITLRKDIHEDECISAIEKDKKNEDSGSVAKVVVSTIGHFSNTVKIGEDASCLVRHEREEHKETQGLEEETNRKSEKDIIYNTQNEGAKTEKEIVVDKDMLQNRFNDETETCITDKQGVILEANSSSTKDIITSVIAAKPKPEFDATEYKLTVGVNETEPNYSEEKEDTSSLIEGEHDMTIKPCDEYNKDEKEIENGETARNSLTTEGKEKGEIVCPVSDLHKRVLEKLSRKTSLVRKVNDHSLKLLENSKTSNSSGSLVELAMDDNLMEVDDSFDACSDTDSFDLKANNNTETKNKIYAENDYRAENEIDELNVDQSLTSVTETDMEDTSFECRLDTSKSPEVTEQNSAGEQSTNLMSEYNDCSTNMLGGESETYFGVVDNSDASMHISDTVDIGVKNVNNRVHVFELEHRDSLNIGDAKVEKIDALGMFAVDEFGSKDTNNIDDAHYLENRDTPHVDVILESMDTDSKVSEAKLGCVDSHNSDAAIRLESKDTSSMVYANTVGNMDTYDTGNKDKHDMIDDNGHCEVTDAFQNEGLDDLLDSELRKKYNIREAFVSLGKIDNQPIETDDELCDVDNQQSEIQDQQFEVDEQTSELDDQGSEVGDMQSKLNDQGSEAEYQQSKVNDRLYEPIPNDNQACQLEDQQKEAEGKKEDTVKTDNCEHPVNDSPLDKTCEEPGDSIASDMHSPMKGFEEGKSNQEKLGLTPNEGKRTTVPLSERFGQLAYRPEETETQECANETVYKAEFENIINRLKKNESNDQTESKTEHENMDTGDGKGDDVANESKKASEKDKEMGDKNDKGNTANQSGSRTKTELSGVKPYTTSPVSFLDYSDESDDELLVTPSAFLRSIEEINGRPVVITPTKVMDSSQNSTATTSSSDLSPLKPVAQRPGLKNKFTLDGLLLDHEEKADLVKEMDEIDQQLQDEIRQGGFVNILNREDAAAADSQITEEQKEMLKQFEVEESRICEDRPGVLVFDPQHYQCLFTSMLRPTDCGFTVGSNGLLLEKHLESLTPAQCKRVITSGIISQCFTKISCQAPLMRWLFFIISVHDDYQVQQGCKKILLEILHFQHIYGPQKWAPRLVDVLSVLVNFGAALESLIPCGSSTLEIISGKLTHEPDHIHQPVPQNAGMNTENLILMLQILAQCLHGPSGRYSPNDLSLLCVALCEASLDTSLKNFCAKGAFQNCITMVIRQYLEADWLKERLKLTRMLVSVTDHHHNSAHIAELFPPGVRGMYLQRRFCYLVLSEILLDKTNVSDDVLMSIQIKDLEKFIPKIKELLENDSYKLSSVVTLIDLCVGVHVTLNSEQREQLKDLLEQVRRVRVRDNVSMLDRTRVKDMIVRMTSKWALDIQTMKGKQTKIFEYASPVKMHIEAVHALQSSGEEEEDHSDSDSDLPCKIQKLSPDLNT
ncbi:uncharacterized protein LOC123546870 [Mercenaria mercenaria]|uniref:uncharacterized protein LOC123546870 n=1 Tax=Mercenaria mercenaria TaxID=6596 RepID=UPI00234E4234|nr:uncharacterized protein LOC123546870 [Mercenaria mercenaria]